MFLSSSPYVHDVRAHALTNEFTWNEWTELRHSYLCARHQARFHPQEWISKDGALPSAFRTLIENINEVVPPSARNHSVALRSLPPLQEIHTLHEDELGRCLLHLTAQPAIWIRDSWEGGLLPLLILRLLEIEANHRMGWDTDQPRDVFVDDASTSYGFEHWVPHESFQVRIEGLLEDVAYHQIAHNPEVAVTIESLDGTECYFAASKGLVIGENLLVVPAQGDLVVLRTWTPGLTESVSLGAGRIDVVEEIAALRIASKYSNSDALVRFVLLVDGGEEAPLTWVRWTANEMMEWVDSESEVEDDTLDAYFEDEPDPRFETVHGIDSAQETLNVLRVDQPSWVSDRSRDRKLDRNLLGEQAEWSYALPWMYRLIASDHPGAVMPRCPRVDDSVFDGPCGYWAALWELLTYNLGWNQPELGLERWLADGRPVTDRKLLLLRDIWWADGQLDWFRAWLYQLNSDWQSRSERHDARNELEGPSEQWFAKIRTEIQASGFRTSPFGGGTDPLHLRSHGRGPLDGEPFPITHAESHEVEEAETNLVLPGLGGWYFALGRCNRSCKVRVLVPWIGQIGVFSCSPLTGIWHSTSEDIHLSGNLRR